MSTDSNSPRTSLGATVGANQAEPYLTARHDEGSRYFKSHHVAEWLDLTVKQVTHIMLELEERGVVSRWSAAQPVTWYVEDVTEVADEQ